jgi:hypothetical protein
MVLVGLGTVGEEDQVDWEACWSWRCNWMLGHSERVEERYVRVEQT